MFLNAWQYHHREYQIIIRKVCRWGIVFVLFWGFYDPCTLDTLFVEISKNNESSLIHVKLYILSSPPNTTSFPHSWLVPEFWVGARVAGSEVLCVYFVDRWLSFFFWPLFCLAFFVFGFWLPLWYLQCFLTTWLKYTIKIKIQSNLTFSCRALFLSYRIFIQIQEHNSTAHWISTYLGRVVSKILVKLI